MATDTPLQEGSHVDTRDFRILSCTLISSAGVSIEIGNMIPEIQVRQDMYMGIMSGELMINDGIDLLAQFQVNGGEYLFLHLTVPEQQIELKKAFRIYKIGNRIPMENAQKYTIYFVSDELFSSHTQKISKAYKNATVSDMAQDIMANYLKIPESKIFVDPTDTPFTMILPNMRPLEALNWLASRAYTDKKNTWFFYENFEGFHFKSLNTIYKSPKPIKVPYTFENKKGNKNIDMDKFAIDDIETRRDFDTISTVSSGGYAMKLNTMNLISREIATNEYRLDSSVTKLYENAPIADVGELFKKSDAHLLTYVSGFGIEEYVKRTMAMAALNSNLVEIAVPGNMGLNAGTIVSIRVPYTIVPTEGDMWSKQKGGKFLIFAVNHKFDLVQHKYTTLAYICRDSLPESLPPISKTLEDKIKKLQT